MAPLIFDVVSYRNQLEACKRTFGIVPHPAFERLEAPSGQPMTTPWIVCAVGRPAEQAKPANDVSIAPQPDLLTPQRAPVSYDSIALGPAAPWGVPTPVAQAAYYAPAPVSHPSSYQDLDEGRLPRIIRWIVERIFPFYLLQELGEWLDEDRTLIRAAVGACCAALVMMALRHQPGAWEPVSSEFAFGWVWIFAACASALGAWKGPSLLGGMIRFLTSLLAFTAFVVTVCAALGGVAYAGFVLFGSR